MAFWPGRRCFVITGLKSEGPSGKDSGGSVGNGMCNTAQSSRSISSLFFWVEV